MLFSLCLRFVVLFWLLASCDVLLFGVWWYFVCCFCLVVKALLLICWWCICCVVIGDCVFVYLCCYAVDLIVLFLHLCDAFDVLLV